MALADYYARNALAASQVLAGFDAERIRQTLDRQKVGLCVGTDAAESPEGRMLVDLLIRLIARLYPTLVIRSEVKGRSVADDAANLASRISPAVEFSSEPTVEVVVGTAIPSGGEWPRIFAGSCEWNALVGTRAPRSVGASNNPFGAGVAACLAAANLFRLVFLSDEPFLDADVAVSTLGFRSPDGMSAALSGSLGEMVLIGAGAIGNGAGWALSHTPMDGVLRVVDYQSVDLGNLQRYVLAERDDEGASKVSILRRHFTGKVTVQGHALRFEDFVSSEGYKWTRMMLALDSSRDRRAAQASLPRWIANAWTQPGDLGVSTHDFLTGACVACLYLPEHILENEDAIIAAVLGVPSELMQIRTLLFNGEGVPRALLDKISTGLSLPIERLLPFEGRTVRELYAEGFCGGAVITLGEAGTPRQEVHVPLAHQSALTGVLLAAAAVREALGLSTPGTEITRINVMRALGVDLIQPAAKDPRGICICQDQDYQEAYRRKYAGDSNGSATKAGR